MEPEELEHILHVTKKPIQLQLSLMRNITENFSKEREIGKGGFAMVYKGVLPNGSVAVKRIMNNHTIDDALFYREVDSLLAVDHPNIVKFLGYCASTDLAATPQEGTKAHIYAEQRERLLCFEYIGNGSLKEYITDELRGLEWNTRYEIIKGICNGLDYLHNDKRIYHMDLKPANILLNTNMVPKITDFGQSRYDEKSQTLSLMRYGTRGYCPPEYTLFGKMSPKSDMYSLGIIIIELVTGDKEIPNNNKSNVLRRWRHRWKKTGKETPLVYQQVTKCIEIGLGCQEIDPMERPPIEKVIRDIKEMDSTDGQTRNAYESFSLISPYPEDDTLGIEPLELHFPFELNKEISCSLRLTNQTDAYIAYNIQNLSHLQYCTQPNKDTVPPRSNCSVHITLHPQDNAPRNMHRADEFIVWSTKVNYGLSAEDITMNMFSTENGVVDAMNLDVVFDAEESTQVSKELILHSSTDDKYNTTIDGTVWGMNKSQERLPTPLRTSSTGSQNHHEAVKESSATQQVSDKTSEIESGEELRPDIQCIDKLLLLNTNANKDLVAQSVPVDIISKTYGKVAGEGTSRHILSPTPTLMASSICNPNYQEGAQEYNEPQSALDTTSEVTPGSSALLDVHPLELHFRFEPNKFIACSLYLTNNTDEKVEFELMKKTDERACFLKSLPLVGRVDPGTSYTLVLIMDKHEHLPEERNVDLILQTSTSNERITKEELGNTVHKVTLRCVCALQGETILESIPPSVKFISMEDYNAIRCTDNSILSIDAIQTGPLIIIGHDSGHVLIWNYDTQESMGSIQIQHARKNQFYNAAAMSVKFIARKGWCLVGSSDGFIHVYDYINEMKKITSFKAKERFVTSVAIHPTQPYVLSAGWKGINLWDWDHGWFGWKHKQTFKEHSDYITAIAFNPEDYNCFATASYDGTIKVWNLDSPKSKYTLSGHWVDGWSLDFFTRDGQHYLITGSEIWDLQKKECVRTLPHTSVVSSVFSHPKLPLLLTGTEGGDVYFWSSTSFRLERILKIGGRTCVTGFACLNESGRVVVAHHEGLMVIEVPDEEEGQGSSNCNDKNSISATE